MGPVRSPKEHLHHRRRQRHLVHVRHHARPLERRADARGRQPPAASRAERRCHQDRAGAQEKVRKLGEAQLAKYAPVLAYEETENQQIEPKAAKWVPYKKIKSLLSAEESHEPVPRKKKEKRRAARNDDDHESIDEGEAPTLALLGAVGVKRFKVPPGIKAKLLQLNRHVYVVLQEDPIAALAERS